MNPEYSSSEDGDDSDSEFLKSTIKPNWLENFKKYKYSDENWCDSNVVHSIDEKKVLPSPCVNDILQLIRGKTNEQNSTQSAGDNVSQAVSKLLEIDPSRIAPTTETNPPECVQSNGFAPAVQNGYHQPMNTMNFNCPPLSQHPHQNNPYQPQMPIPASIPAHHHSRPPMTSIPRVNIGPCIVDNAMFTPFPYMRPAEPNLPTGAHVVDQMGFYMNQTSVIQNAYYIRPNQVPLHNMPTPYNQPYSANQNGMQPNTPAVRRDPRIRPPLPSKPPKSPPPAPPAPPVNANPPVYKTQPRNNTPNNIAAARINQRRRISLSAYRSRGQDSYPESLSPEQNNSEMDKNEPESTAKEVDSTKSMENNKQIEERQTTEIGTDTADEPVFSPAVSSEHNSSPNYSPAPISPSITVSQDGSDIRLESDTTRINDLKNPVNHVENEPPETNDSNYDSDGSGDSNATEEFEWDTYKQNLKNVPADSNEIENEIKKENGDTAENEAENEAEPETEPDAEPEAVQIESDVPFPKCEVEVTAESDEFSQETILIDEPETLPSDGGSQEYEGGSQEYEGGSQEYEVDTRQNCTIVLRKRSRKQSLSNANLLKDLEISDDEPLENDPLQPANELDEISEGDIAADDLVQAENALEDISEGEIAADDLLHPMNDLDDISDEDQVSEEEKPKVITTQSCTVVLIRDDDLIRRYVPTYQSIELPRPVVKPMQPVMQTPTRNYEEYSPINLIDDSDDDIDDNNNESNAGNDPDDFVIEISDDDE